MQTASHLVVMWKISISTRVLILSLIKFYADPIFLCQPSIMNPTEVYAERVKLEQEENPAQIDHLDNNILAGECWL